jgi:hypothetical protein
MKTFALIASLFFYMMNVSSAQNKANPKAIKKVETNNASSAPLNGRMEYIMIGDENKGEYFGGCVLKSGKLKVGQTVSVTDDAGHLFSLKVVKIKDYNKRNDMGVEQYVTETGPSNDLSVDLISTDGKKLDGITGGFNFGSTNGNGKEMATTKAEANCKLNNIEWFGKTFANSCLYYEHGNPLMNEKNPFILLTFQSAKAPDTRQLNVVIKNFSGQKGIVDKNKLELALSGAEDGSKAKSGLQSNWENGAANTTKTNFNFQITKWELSGDQITISGKFSGKLFGFNPTKVVANTGDSDVDVINGSFENVIVKYFKETYTEQENLLKKK